MAKSGVRPPNGPSTTGNPSGVSNEVEEGEIILLQNKKIK